MPSGRTPKPWDEMKVKPAMNFRITKLQGTEIFSISGASWPHRAGLKELPTHRFFAVSFPNGDPTDEQVQKIWSQTDWIKYCYRSPQSPSHWIFTNYKPTGEDIMRELPLIDALKVTGGTTNE